MRFLLPVGNNQLKQAKRIAPHEGRSPSYTSFSWVNNQLYGDQLALKVRPAYYDSLDSGSGHIVNSSLSMAEFDIRIGKDSWYMTQFNLFKVESVHSQTTGLAEDSGTTWNLRAAWVQLNSANEKTVFSIQGDYGTSFKTMDKLLISAFIGGGVQDKYKEYSNIFVRAGLTMHYNVNDRLRFRFDATHKENINALIAGQNIYSLNGRYQLSLNQDIRLYYQDDANREFGLSYGYYW
ncbi:MAG: hypothetical protein Q9M92_08790 [Enterobacterales bacterium]|nr:hypothetical protein [Enterobacterales bacterium]